LAPRGSFKTTAPLRFLFNRSEKSSGWHFFFGCDGFANSRSFFSVLLLMSSVGLAVGWFEPMLVPPTPPIHNSLSLRYVLYRPPPSLSLKYHFFLLRSLPWSGVYPEFSKKQLSERFLRPLPLRVSLARRSDTKTSLLLGIRNGRGFWALDAPFFLIIDFTGKSFKSCPFLSDPVLRFIPFSKVIFLLRSQVGRLVPLLASSSRTPCPP